MLKELWDDLIFEIKLRIAYVKSYISHDHALSWLLWGTLGFVILLGMRTCSLPDQRSKYESEIADWKSKANHASVVNDSLKKEIQGLNVIIRNDSLKVFKLSNEISSLKQSVNEKKKKNDAVFDSLKNALPDTCKAVIAIAEEYKSEVETLSVALTKAEERDSIRAHDIMILRSTIGKLEVKNDSLIHLIKTVPVAKTPKILGLIPYPSRKTSFIGGAVIGVVSTAILVAATH